jgi:hypothetical protein
VVIESDGENQGHDEEQDQDAFVVRADYQQEKEADQQNDKLSGNDVGENCAHEETVFAFEKSHAVRAVMPDVKRLVNNLRLATRRTPQSHRPPEDPLDLFQVYFQGVSIYYATFTPQERPERNVSRKGAKRNEAAKMCFAPSRFLCFFA